MTDSMRGHAHFDELAAGYALHALDPEDELQFARHLRECHRCRVAVSDYTEVTAAFADTGSTGQPSPQLGDRILAAVAREAAGPPAQRDGQPGLPGQPGQPRGRDGQADPPPAPVVSLSRHRGQPRRLRTILASAAAVAALVAGGATWAGLASHDSGASRAVASCAAAGQCREVVLTDARSHRPSAKVIVKDGTVWLMPSALPADNTSRHIYVLWQITGAQTPLAVGSFDISGRSDKPVRIGALAVPYQHTWAFAVTLEPGRTIPATPSHQVALGQVSS